MSYKWDFSSFFCPQKAKQIRQQRRQAIIMIIKIINAKVENDLLLKEKVRGGTMDDGDEVGWPVGSIGNGRTILANFTAGAIGPQISWMARIWVGIRRVVTFAAVTFSATLLHQSLVFIFAANILTTSAVNLARSPSAVLAKENL